MKTEAHAKVNLTLEVFGRRPDGYHALRSVVTPISLADELEVEATDDGTLTSDTGYDDDLCLKAARVFRAQYASTGDSASRKGAVIRVVKRIPSGGGLGGGSADAAAVLRALNELWELNLPRAELAEIGAQVGSDVPALVVGGPVLMEGRGEKVTPLSLPAGGLNLVLANPGVPCSTREVYARCEPRSLDAPSAADRMVAALSSEDLRQVAAAVENDLQVAAKKLRPEIADALASLRTVGLTGVTMTGSGSCVFGFAESEDAAKRISASLASHGLQAWAVRTL